MGTPLNDQTKEELFTMIKHRLGAPIRKIELDWDQMCSLLETSIEDYAQRVQDWLIENQWSSLLGNDVDNVDIAFALTTRSLDFESRFAYAYSKQVGLQQRGPWELKKDYVTIVANQQVYQVPSGREINEILWITPNSTDHALYSFAGMGDYGFGGGFGQVPYAGGGGGGLGNGGFYVAPAFDVLLRAADFSLKSKLLRSELTYKVTAGPNGTRLLHLMPIPGSRLSFSAGGLVGSQIGLTGTKVWYHYYDSGDNRDQCLIDNPDIIKLPNDVPLSKLQYSDLNEPTRVWVRRYLTSLFKEALGRVRGKFSGALKVPEAELTMDYDSLLNEGKEEQLKLLEQLDLRLERLSNLKQLENKGIEAENLNKSLSYRPLGLFVI